MIEKLVATLGKRMLDEDDYSWIVDQGVRWFRLNLARNPIGRIKEFATKIQTALQKQGVKGEIIYDIPGIKMRLTRIKAGLGTGWPALLHEGEVITLTDSRRDPELGDLAISDLETWEPKCGMVLQFHNGGVRCQILEIKCETVIAMVIKEGTLHAGSGVTIDGNYIPHTRLSEREREFIAEALSLGGRHLSLSFVDSGMVLMDAKKFIQSHRKDSRLIAKVESEVAVPRIEEIVRESQGVVLARGDLSRFFEDEQMDDIAVEMASIAKNYRVPLHVATGLFRSHKSGQLDSRESNRIKFYDDLGAQFFWSDETSFSKEWRAVITIMAQLGKCTI